MPALAQLSAWRSGVNSGSQPLDSAEFHLNFDPTVLEVVEITQVFAPFGVQLPGSGFNNTNGTLDYYSGTVTNLPNGLFTVANVTFRAKVNASASPLTLSTTEPRQTRAFYNGGIALAATNNAIVNVGTGILTPTATPSGYLWN
jgi:hypothetical protein